MEVAYDYTLQDKCLFKSDIQIVKTIEFDSKEITSPSGWFSVIHYDKKTDEVSLLSDFKKGYLVRINSFSKSLIHLRENLLFGKKIYLDLNITFGMKF